MHLNSRVEAGIVAANIEAGIVASNLHEVRVVLSHSMVYMFDKR